MAACDFVGGHAGPPLPRVDWGEETIRGRTAVRPYPAFRGTFGGVGGCVSHIGGFGEGEWGCHCERSEAISCAKEIASG